MKSPEDRRLINLKGKLLMLAGVIAFPAMVLLPYYIHSSQYYFILAAPQAFTQCTAGYTITKTGQCMSWQQPAGLHLAVALGCLGIILLGLVTFRYLKNLKIKEVMRFTTINLLVAILITIVSIAAYHAMHGDSQNRVIPVDIPPGLAWHARHEIPLGFGITSASLVLLSTLYLIFPIVMWFQVRFGSQHIGALKKKELFQ